MRTLKVVIAFLLLCSLLTTACAEMISAGFPAVGGKSTYHVELDFDDSMFMQDSDRYDHRIARVSLGMAVAAFRSETVTYVNSDSNIREFLAEAGFENYEAEEFDVIPTQFTIASAIASKRLPDGSLLIAVAISGQGYRDEWMSNFMVGGDDTHEGFRTAAGVVFERLEAYKQKYAPDGRVRVWTAGFSRAAATTNLFAARLIQSDLVDDNDVFAYTFGTPSTTKTPIAYPQIYNICNSFDPVAFIPFSNWLYGKHGTTLYLPAGEVDLAYPEKLRTACDAFEQITGSRSGFYSNVNANWFLSKFMEVLYQLLPESTYYSEDFQQAFIDTWAVKGSALDKLVYLVVRIINTPELSGKLNGHGGNAGTLLSEGFYGAYLDIAGKRSGRWADLFANAAQLVHEHEPAVYMAWLMSTDDPTELFDHPTAYTRLILAGDFDIAVYDANDEQIENRSFCAFTLNNQMYYAIPDGLYKVILTPKRDVEGVIALRYHDVRKVSETLYQTEKMHFFANEQITVSIMPGGEYSLRLGAEDVSILDETANGLESVTNELTLTGSSGADGVRGIATSLIGVMLPHVLSIALIIIYCILMVLFKLITRTNDEFVETHAFGRILLVGVTAACLISAGRHFYFFIAEFFNRLPDLENHTAIRVAELLGIGTQVYQITDAILYLLLAMLAWRGRRRHRSRIRGRRLSFLFFIMKLLAAISADFAGTLTYYNIGCILFFIGCFIAFIIVRDRRYEKELWKRNREIRRQRRAKRKRMRAAVTGPEE